MSTTTTTTTTTTMEITKTPEWPVVRGKRIPIPPVPPKPITLESIMEDMLSVTIYLAFKLVRHPNHRGVWTLGRDEKYPTPKSLKYDLAVLDYLMPLWLDNQEMTAARCKVKTILIASLAEERAARAQNPQNNSSAVVGIHRRRAFHCETTFLNFPLEFDGKVDFVISNAAEPGTGISALVWLDPYPLSIMWECISLMGAVHNARKHENKRVTEVYGIATNGEQFYLIVIDDNAMVSWHEAFWTTNNMNETNEIYSFIRRFFHDITGRNNMPIPGTEVKEPKHPLKIW